ncbi:MAG: AAA family ATPase [Bacteroidia bacterium]
MKNHFKNVTIENFKSIKKLDFDCKRVNIFLGEPNVGKSNILEALSLFSAPLGLSNKKGGKPIDHYSFAWDQIRYKNLKNLFFFQDVSKPINVITDKGQVQLSVSSFLDSYNFIIGSKQTLRNEINTILSDPKVFFESSTPDSTPNFVTQMRGDGIINFNQSLSSIIFSYQGFVKKYAFNETYFKEELEHNKFQQYLLPSYGSNIFTIVQGNHELADLVAGFFEKYNLEFIFIHEQSEYVIQRKQGRIGYQLPYDSIADTLQRIIFHLAAIYSNKDSVILFEEPESHSFPDYIQLLATKIIESESNQFFITTHSPYLVQKLLQGLDYNELAVNVAGYKDHQTVMKQIEPDEIDKMIDRGSDIFFNLPQF